MRRALVSLVVVCATWGSIPLVARRIDLPPVAIVFVRVWVGAAALAAIGLLPRIRSRRAAVAAPTRRSWISLALVGPLLALHWTAMFAGYQRGPDDVVVFVIFLAPVGIALAAPSVLGERLRTTTIVALVVAVAGFVLVAGPGLRGAGGAALAVAFAALSGLTLVVLVLVSKPLAETMGGLRLTRIELAGAGVALLPFALRIDWGSPTAATWFWLAVLGIVHTAAGTAIYLSALAKVPATQVGILGYLEPVGLVVLSWVLLGESPSATTAAGGALIVLAGAFVIRSVDDRDAARSLPRLPTEARAGVPG